MVVAGAVTAMNQAARGVAPAGFDPLEFLMIPLSDVLLFGGFVAAALPLRANREAHKRLMLLAYVCIVTAAIGRLRACCRWGRRRSSACRLCSFSQASSTIESRAVACIRCTAGGGTMLVISIPLRLLISGTNAWRHFAQWLLDHI